MKEQLRTFLSFEADFPDDGTWDEQGNPIVPTGKNIADFLVSALASQGFACRQLNQHSYYGWSWITASGSRNFWVLLQVKLLISRQVQTVLDRILGRDFTLEHRNLLSTVHKIAKRDSRFQDLQWFTKQEYEAVPRPLGTAEP
jgi:hypothetical protein